MTMTRNSSYINRIAQIILAEGDYQYSYDPEHRNRPEWRAFETEKGWSNDPKDDPKNKQVEQQNVPRGTNPIDVEYFKAIESGDTEAVQRMVTEKAGMSGYSEMAYHGSDETEINEFNQQNTASGYFFTPDKESAEYYTGGNFGKVYRVFLNLGKNADWDDDSTFREIGKEAIYDLEEEPSEQTINYIFDSLDRSKHKFDEEMKSQIDRILSRGRSYEAIERIIDELEFSDNQEYQNMATRVKEFVEKSEKVSNAINQARDTYENSPGQMWYLNYQEDFLKASMGLGYDSVTLTDAKGGGGVSTSHAVFNSNLIKSADPIVKDDEGNIIPLSQRFNAKSNDIRY
jgi:hypothetical protein